MHPNERTNEGSEEEPRANPDDEELKDFLIEFDSYL